VGALRTAPSGAGLFLVAPLSEARIFDLEQFVLNTYK